MVIEIKRSVEPRDVSSVVAQLRIYAASMTPHALMVVVAPFLSRQTRHLLDESAIGYVDFTGNTHLKLDRPALYIRDTGAERTPYRVGKGPLQSLKGRAAGRVVRALCDFTPPFGIRALAARTGTSIATISRVASFLEREALARRGPRGDVVELEWDKLIERWADYYSLTASNRTRTYIEPRGLDALQRKLREAALRYAITGPLAAARIAPVAPARLAVLFVDDFEIAASTLTLRPVEKGANVLLAEPFDPVVYDRLEEYDGLRYAAVSQVAADLLTGPGCGTEEGEELLRWMSAHENEWRKPL